MPIKLIYKEKEHAVDEHMADRITQLRDIYGFIIEERMIDPRLNLYNRFAADHADILKADPDNFLAQAYLFAYTRDVKNRPEYNVPYGPDEIPRRITSYNVCYTKLLRTRRLRGTCHPLA